MHVVATATVPTTIVVISTMTWRIIPVATTLKTITMTMVAEMRPVMITGIKIRRRRTIR